MKYRAIHYVFYSIGIFVTSMGTILMKRANFGMAPWSASHVNLSILTNLSIGTSNAIHTSFLLLTLLLLTLKWKSLNALVTIVLFSLTLDSIDLVLLKGWVFHDEISRSWVFLVGFFFITFGNAVLIHSTIPAFILDQVGEALKAKWPKLTYASARTFLNAIALTLSFSYALLAGVYFGGLTWMTLLIGLTIGPIIGWQLQWLRKVVKI